VATTLQYIGASVDLDWVHHELVLMVHLNWHKCMWSHTPSKWR